MTGLYVSGRHVDTVKDVLFTLFADPMYSNGLHKILELLYSLPPILREFTLSESELEQLVSTTKGFSHVFKAIPWYTLERPISVLG